MPTIIQSTELSEDEARDLRLECLKICQGNVHTAREAYSWVIGNVYPIRIDTTLQHLQDEPIPLQE